jgi:16S rRNA processing protein RimM
MGTAAKTYRRLARIARSKGILGEVVAVPVGELPLDVWEGLRLWIVPPDHNLIRETRARAASEQGDGLLLTLEGVADRSTAQRLRGRFLLACADDVCGWLDEDDGEASPVGWGIIDERHGFLGTIVEERPGKAQKLWVLDGSFGELLVPAVEDFILSREGDVIHTRLPDGLVELNREDVTSGCRNAR